MPHSWRRALSKAIGGNSLAVRLVTSHIWVLAVLPLSVRSLSRRAICIAPTRPSCMGSISRMTTLRTSCRPRLISRVRAVRWACCSAGGKKNGRQEGLGTFQQLGLIAFKGEQVIGSGLKEQFTGGLVLGMHGINGDEPALQLSSGHEAANGWDFIFHPAFGLARAVFGLKSFCRVNRFDSMDPAAGDTDGREHDLLFGGAERFAIDDHQFGFVLRAEKFLLPLDQGLF